MGSSDVDAAVAWPGERKLHVRLGDEEAGTAIFECFTGAALHRRITRADFKSKDEVFLKSVRADVGGGGVEEYRVIMVWTRDPGRHQAKMVQSIDGSTVVGAEAGTPECRQG